MRLLGMQARTLEAQRDHMQNMMAQDINVLRTSFRMVFTQSHVDAWLDFSDTVTAISQLPFPDVMLKQWAGVRGNIVTLFGVNLSPLVTDDPPPDPDANFVCPEPFRSQILTAGSMTRPITLGNKTVTVYIQENMITPFQPFTGEKEDESLKELFSRLDLVHRAPVDQISYKMKIEAVFPCLDGKAKNAVIGYFGGKTQPRYPDLWAQLFQIFCNKGHDVARQIRLINEAAPKSTDASDIMGYMNVLSNAGVRLDMLEFPQDQIAGLLWNSLLQCVTAHILKYCEHRVPRFDLDFGSDVATWHSTDGYAKFKLFYAYILSRTLAESSTRTVASVLHNQVNPVPPPVVKKNESKKNSNQKRPANSNGATTSTNPPAKVSENDNSSTSTPASNTVNLAQIMCFICKEAPHPWRECMMMTDGRETTFANDGHCRKCSSQDHVTSECHGMARCEHCVDPNDPTKDASHHTALCYKKYGRLQSFSQRGGRGGKRSGRGGRGGCGGQNSSAPAADNSTANPQKPANNAKSNEAEKQQVGYAQPAAAPAQQYNAGGFVPRGGRGNNRFQWFWGGRG
jgi:hypothetical protein